MRKFLMNRIGDMAGLLARGPGRRWLAGVIAAAALILGGTAMAAAPAHASTTCNSFLSGVGLNTANVSDFSVGQSTFYDASGPSNCPLYWSSWKNTGSGFVSTGEVNDFYGQYTNEIGSFAQYGNAWRCSDIGTWIKEVQFGIGGPVATVQFSVDDPSRQCG